MSELPTLAEIFDERFLCEHRLAKYLDCHVITVQRWVRKGAVSPEYVEELGELIGEDLSRFTGQGPGRPGEKQPERVTGLVEMDGRMVWLD